MSDEGDKTCPLCAEEMDLTDQQLKPCKCGYEICVWCWHHIIDMAEKDETEGRCPACRTPYNKEKVVGTAEKCERLVAEMSMEKKLKMQKAKSKTTEGRKQLSSVRVVQRNLVYIVGLPLNLADEELLQGWEYFGQYGKVLKVSISRTATGDIQNFANNTCSVYITYSKEDEAVRCIQSVHGFVLEGRPLKACYGTTKYCHAWLRNVPCSNPDCLYLHEIGSQEDSFTKDEIISSFTRIQQITGATNGMQRRLGNMLPPPADDYTQRSATSSGKHTSRSTLNNTIISVRSSPPNNTSGHSIACPALSWPSKQMPESVSGSMDFSTAVASTTKTQSNGEDGKKLIPNEGGLTMLHKDKYEHLESIKPQTSENWRSAASVAPTSGPSTASTNTQLHSSMKHEVKHGNVEENASTAPVYLSKHSYSSTSEEELNVHSEGKVRNLCSRLLSVGINRHSGDENSGDAWIDQVHSDDKFSMLTKGLELKQLNDEQSTECLTSVIMRNETDLADAEQLGCGLNSVTKNNPQAMSDSLILVEKADSHVGNDEVEEDLRHFDTQRLKDPEVIRPNGFLSSSHIFHLSNHLRDQVQPFEHRESPTVKLEGQILDKKVSRTPFFNSSGVSAVHNGYPEFLLNRVADLNQSIGHLLPSEVNSVHMKSSRVQFSTVDQSSPLDMCENNIISNTLSTDIDAWDTPLASPRDFSMFLGESDNHQGTLKVSSSTWKVQSNSQSRFSFAREGDPKYERSYHESALGSTDRFLSEHLLTHHDVSNSRDVNSNLGSRNGFYSNFQEPDIISRGYSSNKFPVSSRAQSTAPPGFSAPSRTPPPGFASHERIEKPFDPMSGNHLLDVSSLLRNSNQAPPTVNAGSNTLDIELMDPAILAVCEGITLSDEYHHHHPGGGSALDVRTNPPLQIGYFENESARTHLLMQQRSSLSPLQNNHQRLAEIGDSYSTTNSIDDAHDSYSTTNSIDDAHGIPPSRTTMDQSLLTNSNQIPSSYAQLTHHWPSRLSGLASNGQWDHWNEVVSSRNEVGTTDNILRSERLGLNKFRNGYDDSKFVMGPSNPYNGGV